MIEEIAEGLHTDREQGVRGRGRGRKETEGEVRL
jgi:hypothetical protein